MQPTMSDIRTENYTLHHEAEKQVLRVDTPETVHFTVTWRDDPSGDQWE